MPDARAAAHARFASLTGAVPEGVWSAPGRVNLIGEHTDYNEGYVLPFAIGQRTFTAASRRVPRGDEPATLRIASTFAHDAVEVPLTELGSYFPAAGAANGRLPQWSTYVLGVAWALLEIVTPAMPVGSLPGIDLAIASDVPVGAGLSSSAALESSVAVALTELWGLDLGPVELARAGRLAENEAVGVPTGIMDQMASMLGEPDAATFIDCRTLETRSVRTGFARAGLDVLVIDTRVAHEHTTGGYRARRESCELGASLLGVSALRDVSQADLPRAEHLMDPVTFRRVRHIVTENQRVLDTVRALDAHGAETIGPLLSASHRSMRDDFEISVAELDLAVDAAIGAGALGARMTGGGFGGSAIALVRTGRITEISDAVRTEFDAAGYTAPHIFTVHPSAGPRREPAEHAD